MTVDVKRKPYFVWGFCDRSLLFKAYDHFSTYDVKLRLSAILGGIRGKKSLGGGTTKLQGGNHHGKKRGLRVYDGQRVPFGTLLAKQFRLEVLPGWNVSKMFPCEV